MAARRVIPVLAGALVAFGMAALPPAAGAAEPDGPLFSDGWGKPLPAGSRAVQVDAATNRMFISSPASNVVSVLGLDGELLGSIAVPGADDMLLDGSTLYVAATTAGRIDAFNTATLAPAGSYGAGTLVEPGSLAKAGGRVWSTSGACLAGLQPLVSFVPGSPAVTVHPVTDDLIMQCAALYSSAASPNLLVGYDGALSPTSIFRIDVSAGTPVRTGSLYADAYTSDLEFLPGGQTFALATRATSEILTFRVDPFEQWGVVYPVGGSPSAVGSTAGNGGLVAFARDGIAGVGSNIIVMRLGDPSRTLHFESTPTTVKGGALAFSPDGTSLYAVSSDDSTGEAVLTIIGPPDRGRYHPLPPARILDTRDGGPGGRLGADATADVQVTGRGGVPAAGVTAVALNVTVTQPTATSFLTLFPAGRPRPLASSLNYTPAKTVPNLVVVKVGAGGKVSMYNLAGATDVIFDVAGWYSNDGDDPAGDGRYTGLVPSRILDTRDGGVPLGPNGSLDLQVAGRGGVPAAGVRAAVLNVTATATTATSFVTVHPTGVARPLASNVNFDAGQSVSNRVMATLGAGGKVTIYNLAGLTDIVVDVGGWYSDASAAPATPGTFTSIAPARLLDTRTTYSAAPLAGGTAMTIFVAIPPSPIRALALNVTVVDPAGAGFLTLFPSGGALPLASDVNYAGGETRPNLTVVQVGADGTIVLYTSTTAHVVLDVAGWFS